MRITTLAAARRREINRTAILFSLPAFFFIALYIVYPIINSMVLSFQSWNGYATVAAEWVGWANWKQLLRDGSFWRAAGNNLKIVAISLIVQIPVGMALGFLLDTAGKKLNLLKILWFIPYLLSSVAVGLLFKYAYDPYFGVTKFVTDLLNLGALDLLGNPARALYAVAAVICWQFTPFYMVYFLAGLSGISTDLYEAAIIDGAKRSQYFWRIVLPVMRPTITNACILSLVGSLKYFDLIYVMTGGGPNVSVGGVPTGSTELMATYMYKTAFTQNSLGYGSAIAMGMLIIITAISAVTLGLANRKEKM